MRKHIDWTITPQIPEGFDDIDEDKEITHYEHCQVCGADAMTTVSDWTCGNGCPYVAEIDDKDDVCNDSD